MHAIQVPIQTPELKPGEPTEMWLFRNRFELARIYESLRRETAGIATPLVTLRSRPGYLACFLAARKRSLIQPKTGSWTTSNSRRPNNTAPSAVRLTP